MVKTWMVATVCMAMTSYATATVMPDDGDDARVAIWSQGDILRIGCMRSTSDACHVIVASSKGLERLDVKGGTVGTLVKPHGLIRIAVGPRPPDPAHCVFHDVVGEEQTIAGGRR